MYIWVLLATFIAFIASYNLPAREDARRLAVEPIAEAQVGKLVTKHRAALQYVYDRTPPNVVNIQYVPGKLDETLFAGYLPFGVKNDSNYVSVIYCLNKLSSYAPMTTCEGGAQNVERVLITYGYIPQRWVNLKTGKPSNDYLNAMHNTVSIGTSLGYVDYVASGASGNTLGATLEIRGRGDTPSYIPPTIAQDSVAFGKFCNPDIAGDDVPYCLAYMSSLN